MLLRQYVVAETGCNCYLHDINICSLSEKNICLEALQVVQLTNFISLQVLVHLQSANTIRKQLIASPTGRLNGRSAKNTYRLAHAKAPALLQQTRQNRAREIFCRPHAIALSGAPKVGPRYERAIKHPCACRLTAAETSHASLLLLHSPRAIFILRALLLLHAGMPPRHRSSSGFRGVRACPNCTFYTELRAGGCRLTLGMYDTAELSVRAYDMAAW
jgi:hypothetical protein